MARTPKAWEIPNWRRGGEVIDTRHITQRLEDMGAEHVTDDGDEIPVSAWPRVAQAEHAALTALVDFVKANTGGNWDISSNGDSITLVRHTYLTEYVESWYDDMYAGDLSTFNPRTYRHEELSWRDVMAREPFCWLDWRTVAAVWRKRCPEVEYHGVTYVMDN